MRIKKILDFKIQIIDENVVASCDMNKWQMRDYQNIALKVRLVKTGHW